MTRPRTFSLLLMLSLGLTACGGGGGGDASSDASTSGVAATSVLPTLTLPIPASSYLTGSAELGGYTVLQQARVLCGFGELKQNIQLDAAAQNHARYLTSVSISSGDSVLSHYEDTQTDPYYTGYNPWDRTEATGYGNQVAEILEASVWDFDTRNAPVFPTPAERGANSMRSLLNTVYHLTGAMYEGADVGFGADLQTVSTGTTSRREEYRFGSLNGYQAGRLSLGAGQLATYPCQGSSNIPPEFVPANESPNPFPTMTSSGDKLGPPIYLKVDAGQVLRVTSGRVSQNGVSVPATLLTASNDPHQELGRHEAFVIPNSALTPYATYQVDLAGTINGTPFSRSFAMSTGE